MEKTELLNSFIQWVEEKSNSPFHKHPLLTSCAEEAVDMMFDFKINGKSFINRFPKQNDLLCEVLKAFQDCVISFLALKPPRDYMSLSIRGVDTRIDPETKERLSNRVSQLVAQCGCE